MIPQFDLPPYVGRAADLIEKREAVILASLRGGHTYDDAVSFAEQHVPQARIDQAHARDKEAVRQWNEHVSRPLKIDWRALFGLKRA